jgi:hypothetical protein
VRDDEEQRVDAGGEEWAEWQAQAAVQAGAGGEAQGQGEG